MASLQSGFLSNLLLMRIFYPLLLALVSSTAGFAQAPTSAVPADRVLVKVAPLTLFDPSTSALMLGLEFRPVPRLGLEVDYGFRFTPLQMFYWNRNKENIRYQKFKVEARYYMPRSESKQWYVAAEGFYVPQSYDLQRGTFERPEGRRAYDRAHIERKVRGTALKVGMMRRLGQRFWLDAALGMGIRWREVRYETQNERSADPLFDAPNQNFLAATPDPGRQVRVAPAAALRLGYTLVR